MRKYTGFLLLLFVATWLQAQPDCVISSVLCSFMQSTSLAQARSRLGVAGTNDGYYIVAANGVARVSLTGTNSSGFQVYLNGNNTSTHDINYDFNGVPWFILRGTTNILSVVDKNANPIASFRQDGKTFINGAVDVSGLQSNSAGAVINGGFVANGFTLKSTDLTNFQAYLTNWVRVRDTVSSVFYSISNALVLRQSGGNSAVVFCTNQNGAFGIGFIDIAPGVSTNMDGFITGFGGDITTSGFIYSDSTIEALGKITGGSLEISSDVKFTIGAADGYIWTSDASGNGTWQAAAGGSQTPWTTDINAAQKYLTNVYGITINNSTGAVLNLDGGDDPYHYIYFKTNHVITSFIGYDDGYLIISNLMNQATSIMMGNGYFQFYVSAVFNGDANFQNGFTVGSASYGIDSTGGALVSTLGAVGTITGAQLLINTSDGANNFLAGSSFTVADMNNVPLWVVDGQVNDPNPNTVSAFFPYGNGTQNIGTPTNYINTVYANNIVGASGSQPLFSLFTKTNLTTITNTSTETSVWGLGVGTTNLNSTNLGLGAKYEIQLDGNISLAVANSATLTASVYIGTNTTPVATKTASAASMGAAAVTDGSFHLDFIWTVHSAASTFTTNYCDGGFECAILIPTTSIPVKTFSALDNSGASFIYNAVDNPPVKITLKWSAIVAGDSVTINQASLLQLNKGTQLFAPE